MALIVVADSITGIHLRSIRHRWGDRETIWDTLMATPPPAALLALLVAGIALQVVCSQGPSPRGVYTAPILRKGKGMANR